QLVAECISSPISKTLKWGVVAAHVRQRPHQLQPVIPCLFVTVTSSASLGPCLKCQIQTFNAAPVKESSRIEKDDGKSAYDHDHGEIDPAPGLLCRLGVRKPI